MHQGELTASSEGKNKGATFAVHLPVVWPPPPAILSVSPPGERPLTDSVYRTVQGRGAAVADRSHFAGLGGDQAAHSVLFIVFVVAVGFGFVVTRLFPSAESHRRRCRCRARPCLWRGECRQCGPARIELPCPQHQQRRRPPRQTRLSGNASGVGGGGRRGVTEGRAEWCWWW
jgi:hypothetical protein